VRSQASAGCPGRRSLGGAAITDHDAVASGTGASGTGAPDAGASDPAPATPADPAPAPRWDSRRGWIVTVVLLTAGVIALVAASALLLIALRAADARLDRQDERISEQQKTIDEQERLIDQKETFGEAMQGLLATARQFEGVPVGELVAPGTLRQLAHTAWRHRYDADALKSDVTAVRALAESLSTQLEDARAQQSVNATGSVYESVIDELGGGFVTTSIDAADDLCEADVWGCVLSAEPRAVHIDAADSTQPYMSDWVKTGVAYHEFAHVLQLTNVEQSESALAAFDGDREIMADCFALTYLDGWTLDHRIWVSSTEYWDISVGYGHTCDDRQKQAVRDWYSQLGYRSEPVTQ